jgi:8-oxo-dGTP diphosphatase
MERFKLRAAVYVLLVRENNVLLGRRINTGWRDGEYGLPSGHLEDGESIVDAVLRETREETGVEINVEDIQFVHVMHQKSVYIDFFFVATRWVNEPRIMEEDKCDDLRWFSLNELPKNIIPSVKFAIENYNKGIRFSEYNN